MKFTRKKSTIHGWGLFADIDIPNKDIIEQCTYILITDIPYAYKAVIPYTFPYLKDNNIYMVLPLGYATLLNSSKDPNCIYTIDDNFLTIITIKDVKANEELTLKYI
jgi:hypothetical protein